MAEPIAPAPMTVIFISTSRYRMQECAPLALCGIRSNYHCASNKWRLLGHASTFSPKLPDAVAAKARVTPRSFPRAPAPVWLRRHTRGGFRSEGRERKSAVEGWCEVVG